MARSSDVQLIPVHLSLQGVPMTKKIMACIAGIGFALVGMVAAAEPEQPTQIDCPLARQPYSSNTVLIDLLLDPRSKAVVRSIVPKLSGFSVKPPSFAAVISPRNAPEGLSVPTEKLEELDRALADIPI